MNTIVDLARGAELHVGGASVGVFLPEAQFRELTAEREALRRELEEARRELAVVQAERDGFCKSLLAVMWELRPLDIATCEARIEEARRDGVDFSEVVRQAEQAVSGKDETGRHGG